MNIGNIVSSRAKTYNEYLKDNKNSTWEQWYDNEMVPVYTDVYYEWLNHINCMSFHQLLFKDDKFFNDIHQYMIRTDWSYDNLKVPSIDRLKNVVLELSHSSVTRSNFGFVSTGGFCISFKPNKYLKVQFKHALETNILFERILTYKVLREYKLKRICQC